MDEIKGYMARRVLAGVAFLDHTLGPVWDTQVNLSILDMAHCYGCVLGQLEGDFWMAVRDYGIDDPTQLGFDADWEVTSPWMLDRLWAYVIKARRNARNEN